jgi:hypothetical protein
VAAGTVGERASARPLTHQKPFLDRAAKSHGDVVRVLVRHLFEPAFTHPPEGGDDPLLRETLTLAEVLITYLLRDLSRVQPGLVR